MRGDNVMMLGNAGPRPLPAGTQLGAPPIDVIPAGMGPTPWASWPGSGGPNVMATERQPLLRNTITTPVVSPAVSQQRLRVFNGGYGYGPPEDVPGRRIRGYAIAGLGALVKPWRGSKSSFTMGLGGLVGDSHVTLEELIETRPQDLDPCLNRVTVGTTSISQADVWQGYAGLLHIMGAVVCGVHGYNRNKKSLGWAAAWGAFGFFVPVITTGVALVQGLGKAKGG